MFFKKLYVLCLWSSSFFYCKWWVPEQTQEHHLVLLGLMLVSLCALLPLFSLHWLWHHATLRSNWAIKPLTSMLCQESGLTQRFSLFGRSSSEPEELPSCHSDTTVSDKDSSDDIYATDIHARQGSYKKFQPFFKDFSRIFQGPPTRNIISQIV